ncbi:MAG TPA: transglutaminase-like domain-containing protein [Actinomycetota bacterium]|nr:transglutaminase-like domain-containing protein [Actinomycetota bacterium]
MTRLDVVRRTVAVGIMSLGATAVFIRLFGYTPVVVRLFPVIVLCCVGYALGTAGGQRVQRGLGALVGLITTVIGSLVLGAMTIANQDGKVGVSSFFGGLVEGFGIIVRSVVPAPVNAETVTAAILLSAYGTLVACLLVTTFVPAASLVPAMVIFIVGLMLSQGSTMSAMPFAAVFVASVVAALALMPAAKQQNKIEDGAEFAAVESTPRPGRPLRFVMVTVGAIVVAVVAAALAPLTQIGSIRTAFDPHQRDNFRPDTSLDGDDVVTLATKWQTLRRENPFEVFTVTGPDIPQAVNWAVNSKFDGVAWSSLTTFDQVDAEGIPYSGAKPRFTVDGSTSFETGPQLPGPWLPATYRPIDVTGTPARADSEATIVAADDKGAEKTYTVAFRALAMRSLAPLATVRAVRQPEFGTLRELPSDFPDELRLFAASAMSTGTTPYTRLEALADTLSSSPYQEQVDSIENSLDSAALLDLVLGSQRGTEAQFATAFALMARSQGFPTRMVVGYSTAGKGRSRTVESTDVIVYPEVQLTKVGWVPFAPGPRDGARRVPVIRKVKPPKKDPPAEETPTPSPTPTPTPTPTPSPSPEQQEQTQSRDWTPLLTAALVILLLIAWPVLVAWWRGRLRRRLETGSPDERVIGAWTYVRARRRRLGQPLADTASPAGFAADPATEPKLAGLARLGEAAMYAPEQVSDDDARRAWILAEDVVSSAVHRSSWARRLRWWLVPSRNR